MGFWNWVKRGILIILCILLFVSFLAMNSLFVLSSSLEYKNIQPAVKPILKEVIFGQIDKLEVENSFEAMKLYCQNNTEFDVNQGEGGYNISIPCQDILTGTSDSVLDLQIDKFINDSYYKKYDCSFLQCFKENNTPFFLFSEQSSDYLKNKFYISLLISAILIALIFFLVEFKRNVLVLTGILLVLSSLPFAKLNMFASSISDKNVLNLLSIVFTQANKIFLITFILGIVLLGIGIGLKIWGNKETNIKTRKKK